MLTAFTVVIALSASAASTHADPNATAPSEMAAMQAWVASNFGLPSATQPVQNAPSAAAAPKWPFSFTYGDRPFTELCKDWTLERGSRELDAQRTEHTLTWRDSATHLVVRCVAVVYQDFPTVEWTLYFKNDGPAATPILADIQALDVSLEYASKSEFVLHHAVGSPSDGSDYAPLETPLGPKAVKKIAAAGGRPTNSDLCYFNLQHGYTGWIIAVGWPGQWSSEFAKVANNAVRVRIGQELTHFKLLPGEEIRTPLIVLQFGFGDRDRSQNIWRRWMIAHNLPRPGGKLPPPQLVTGTARFTAEMVKATEENQIAAIDRFVEEKFKIDYWWMDAGWYVIKTRWGDVGTWEVDTKRFPHGLRAICDHAHSKGMKTIVWFEPERVTPGTWLYENHPEWLLGPDGKQKLLNLGNPDARAWLTDHIDKLLTEQGIDLYRQDFNMDPLNYWRAADEPDRQGITENKYASGLLAYWDELHRRHPDMLIDTCASGGRRNDLETLRRAVPLWRSDHPYVPADQQSMTMGISLWIPYQGTATIACLNAPYYGGGVTPVEPYPFWSDAAPSLGLPIDIRERGIDYDALRKLVAEWREISQYYYGDFYPLTACNRLPDAWVAWQFDRPDLDRGVVMTFRRADSPYESARLKLRGLDPEAKYALVGIERAHADLNGDEHTWSGRQLAEEGMLITLPTKPAASVMIYQKMR